MPTAKRRRTNKNKKKRDISHLNITNENNDGEEQINDSIRNTTVSSNSSPSTSMRKCQACLKYFSNLQQHYAKKPICAQMINDSSIVGNVIKKHDNVTQVPNPNDKLMTLNTYEVTQLHDQSAGFFEINDDNEILKRLGL